MATVSARFLLPRHVLLGISAVLWTIPAAILLWRAAIWSGGISLLSASIAAAVAGTTYFFWFSRIVVANIRRIRSLPDRSPFWTVLSVRGYVMIALMVTLGVVLRSSDLPRLYLAPPYALMGGCLLFGSIQTTTSFFRTLRAAHDAD